MTQRNYPAKLASTASGMTFEEWKNRPVYKVQCYTASIANRLCGIKLEAGQGMASVLGADGQGLHTFRALKPYRTPDARELRDRVAQEVRAERAWQRLENVDRGLSRPKG